MKEFLEFVVKQLVSKPEDVKIDANSESDFITFTITVAKEDMAIIIGKNGNTINGIRNLAKAKAIKDKINMRIQLTEIYDHN